MQLDVELAREAVGAVADALGLPVEEAAEGIVDVVNENMVGALRLVSVEKGHDPRDFALVAFGGAGPLHANALAELLGCFPVVIPPTPGVLAALGDVISPFRSEFAETFIRRFDERRRRAEVATRLEALRAGADAWLAARASPQAPRGALRGRRALSASRRSRSRSSHAGGDSTRRRLRERSRSSSPLRTSASTAFGSTWSASSSTSRAVALGRDRIAETPRVARRRPSPSTRRASARSASIAAASGSTRRCTTVRGSARGTGSRDRRSSSRPTRPRSCCPGRGRGRRASEPGHPSRRRDGRARPGESPIVIDIIENALKNIRREMDAVIFRAAMSTVIREEHDSFPLLADDRGRMLAGQFGWPLDEFFAEQYPLKDARARRRADAERPVPLRRRGPAHARHAGPAADLLPTSELVGFASQIGNLMDIGGPVPGSMPARSRSIFDEGIRFPPVKLYERGKLVKPIVDILARNSRTPELTRRRHARAGGRDPRRGAARDRAVRALRR